MIRRRLLSLVATCSLVLVLVAPVFVSAQTPPTTGNTPPTNSTNTNTSTNTNGTTPATNASSFSTATFQKPSELSSQALDTSNFLQNNPSYAWVESVWQAVRQISNILIVVFLFIGALATTLNFNLNTYGIKRVLPSVIQAAIIANFSYILVNVVVEAVGLAQKGILGLGVGGAQVNESTWGMLSSPLRDILNGISPTASTSFGEIIWGFIAALVVGIAMLLLYLTVLVMYLRSFVIALLLTFAPLAILSMALPATQGIWKRWWDEFVKWLMLPLIVCFWLMVAALVAGIAALPVFFKTLVLIFTIWQAVRVPFTFKPAIAGAALTSAGGFLANTGKNAAIGAWYANNLTGGLTRGINRFNQGRAARLNELKDSSTVLKTGRFSKSKSSFGKLLYKFNTGVNAIFEKGDFKTEGRKGDDNKAKVEAQAAAAEARPWLLENIAATNQDIENLNNVLEGMKTAAKATALQTNAELQAETKLAEFRKNAAADMLKTVTGDMNTNALNENSALGKRMRGIIGTDRAMRNSLRAYGVHVKDDGSGYVEAIAQNQVNAQSATEAFEVKAKNTQVGIASRDSGRHNRLSSYNKKVTANDIGNDFRDSASRVGIAEHIQGKLRGVLTDDEMKKYGLDDAGALAEDVDALASAVNLYNNQGIDDADLSSRIESSGQNRFLASRRQMKMVAEDIASGATSMSDVSLPSSRMAAMEEFNERLHGQADRVIDKKSMYQTFALGSPEGSIRDSHGNPITDTKHYAMIAQMKKTLKSLREDAAKGNNGDPDPVALLHLYNFVKAMLDAVEPRSPKYAEIKEAAAAIEAARGAAVKISEQSEPVTTDQMSQLRKLVNTAVSSNYLKNL